MRAATKHWRKPSWRPCGKTLPEFEGRYLPDAAGGVLLLRHWQDDIRRRSPLITASHGPYDPHTLEVALYFLRTGKGGSALVNLGYAQVQASGALDYLAALEYEDMIGVNDRA